MTTFIVCTLLAIAAFFAICQIRKNKSSCGSCKGCPMSANCDKKEKNTD